MLIDALVNLVGLLLMTFATNFEMALVARFICGHAGASSIVSVPIYVGETSQPQLRNFTSNFTVICFTCGFSTILVLGALFPWRQATGISVIIPIISLVVLIFCPESPVWLISKGRLAEAQEALQKLRGEENQDIIDAEINRIQLSMKIEAKEEAIASSRSKVIKDIFTDPGFVKPFGLLCLVFCINFEWCGLAAVAFYLVPLLE